MCVQSGPLDSPVISTGRPVENQSGFSGLTGRPVGNQSVISGPLNISGPLDQGEGEHALFYFGGEQ